MSLTSVGGAISEAVAIDDEVGQIIKASDWDSHDATAETAGKD
jgi:hypothetical protein